jgi:integrase
MILGRPHKQSPEPFWRSARSSWYVHDGTRTVRLSPDKDKAWRLWHELMSQRREGQSALPLIQRGEATTAVEIIDLFLDWVQKNRHRLTYEAYVRRLQAFVDAIPASLSAAELKPYHLTRVMDAHANSWNANTRNDFATAVQRAFNWAEKQSLIERNSIRQIEKPEREARELAINPAQYARIMDSVTEANFRALLEVAWETAASPQELRAIEARHVDLKLGRIIFPPRESKGRKRFRVIYLTARAMEILNPLCEQHPHGTILRNCKDKPWNKDLINCAFRRLEARLGVKYHLGAFRKGYATEGLKNGLDTLTVAHLLGHSNGVMVSKVYGHVQQDPVYMAASARKAKGGS